MKVVLKTLKARTIYILFLASFVAFVSALLLVRDSSIYKVGERDANIKEMLWYKGNRRVMTTRKLLQSSGDGVGRGCSKEDIRIYEGQVDPLPSGIPSYTVDIVNMCGNDENNNDCNIADIRVHCGWFSSARLINPKVFRRIGYDDCLVNDGEALAPGTAISFQYANTYSYPLSVSSVQCL
ncbi:hypothetical protein TanjilG_13181 [Lupinus angustifolius]|uniref:Uncharacterized protein n=1 Tax=Lupinus angustifolius TaxID=3871 RepID=A0A4P1RTY3_LUPAN|nr:PREDICTED: TPD1 protein homolog 1-like [Lupinus angustifolius]OIW18429.1 hypothetical protein TanjilG_13181 [Lupinus angustifolius]